MTITVERLPECKALLRVDVPAEDIAEERQQIVQGFAAQAKLPGFRPGKIPTKVIEKRYKDGIEAEIEDRAMKKGLQQAVSDEKLEIINVAEVSDKRHGDDGGYSCTVEVLTAPEFELPEYKGLNVQAPTLDVTDDQLDEALEQIRERFSQYEDIEDRGAQMGDFAVIDYKGTIDGKPVGETAPAAPATLAQNTGFWLRMADDTFLPGFCADLLDAKPSDMREASITLPEDFPEESMRGLTVDYKIELNELKTQVLPELDDEFAGKVQEGKTLAEVKESLSEQMVEHRKSQRTEIITNQILDQLNAAVECELPQEVVAQETQGRVDQIVQSNAERGIAEDEIMKNQEEIIEAAGKQAAVSVKTSFILEKIADAEDIKVEREEILSRVAQMATQSGTPPKKLYKQLEKENGFGRIANSIRIQKTLEILRDSVELTEVDAPEGAV